MAMAVLLYNINPDWRFDEHCQRLALDWYPTPGRGIRVWDVGRPGIEGRAGLPWPCRVAFDASLVGLDDLVHCSGMPAAFVLCADKGSLPDDAWLQAVQERLASADQRLLYLQDENPSAELLQSCEHLLADQRFTYVAIGSGRGEEERFAQLRLLVEQLAEPNREDQRFPLSLHLGPADRRIGVELDFRGIDRVQAAFCDLSHRLRYWAGRWQEGGNDGEWIRPLETIRDAAAQLMNKVISTPESAPEPRLPKAPLFYAPGLLAEVQQAIADFEADLDRYLETWFRDLNQRHDREKRDAAGRFNGRLGQLKAGLKPRVSIADQALKDRLKELEGDKEEAGKKTRESFEKVRADLLPATRREIAWRHERNRNFRRKYFRQEEVVSQASESAQQAVEYLASAKALAAAAGAALLLALLPVLILRWGYLPPDYRWVGFTLDATWAGTVLLFTLGWLLFQALRLRGRARAALASLDEGLRRLLSRHQEAMRATDAYLAAVLSGRQLSQTMDELKKAEAEHRNCRAIVEDIGSLLDDRCHGQTQGSGDTLDPPRVDSPLGWWDSIASEIQARCIPLPVEQVDERRRPGYPPLQTRFLPPDARVRLVRR